MLVTDHIEALQKHAELGTELEDENSRPMLGCGQQVYKQQKLAIKDEIAVYPTTDLHYRKDCQSPVVTLFAPVTPRP